MSRVATTAAAAATAAASRRAAARMSAAVAAELGTIGLLRRTPVRLRTERVFTAKEVLELHNADMERNRASFNSGRLELNLLEDPTAGLATGPAEELTPTELETQVRVLVSGYAPSLYRMLYMPFVDVVMLLVREDLLPTAETGGQLSTTTSLSTSNSHAAGAAAASVLDGAGASALGAAGPTVLTTSLRPVRPEEVMARWFTDGPATLKAPHATAEAMGKRRWTAFCRALEVHWAGMEDVMPLTRVVRAHNLREELYVPLLRQLAMELVDPTKRGSAVATLPGIILSLANGRAPRSMGLPEKDADRVSLVSNLFLGVAQETGQTDLAYLAVQLLRANDMPTPFSAQKQMTNVFAASARIENDWQMRSTSSLVTSYRKWLEYYKAVQLDNKRALAALQAQRAEAGDATAAADGTAELDLDAMREKRMRSRAGGAQAVTDDADVRSAGEDGPGGAAASSGSLKAAAGAAPPTPDTPGSPAATEQYRYFTSRRQDDVTRVAALERNITDALRSRASELRSVVDRRRRYRLDPWSGAGREAKPPAKPGTASAVADSAAAAAAADAQEVPVGKGEKRRGSSRRGRSRGGRGAGVAGGDDARRAPTTAPRRRRC